MIATIRVKGTDLKINGRSTSELFDKADSMNATRLADSMGGVCVKMQGEWVWIR